MNNNNALSILANLQTNKIDFKLVDALPSAIKPAAINESSTKISKKGRRRE